MNELIFVVTPEEEGGFSAAAVDESIFTQGDDLNDLYAMILDATKCFYFDSEPPAVLKVA
jgi:hypothetical protein